MDKYLRELLSIEGQVVALLLNGDKFAGDIYRSVSATQTTVSRKIARLVSLGRIEQISDQVDRRRTIYRLSKRYINILQESGQKLVQAQTLA